MANSPLYVGCNISNTRIETGLVTNDGSIKSKIQFLSEANKGKAKLIENLISSKWQSLRCWKP